MKSNIKRFAVLGATSVALAMAGAAYADKPGNNGGGNGGCGVGQTTNGCGGGTPAGGNGYGVGVGVGVGVGIGQGGAGGAGGQGGQGGQGGRGGEGGSVWGSGNSSNVNSNKQGQMQGQQQGQAQSSKNSNRNDNRSSATGGNASNSGNNSNQAVTVQGDNYEANRIPVATAYAPNIAPTAVCMGTSSAGAQGVTFGISVGTSWTDDNCMLLEQVRTVASVIGDKEIAAEMMCDVKSYAAARARAGKPCGSSTVASAQAPQQTAAVAPQSMGDAHQPKYAPAAAQTPVVVSPVPPRVERFRVTTAGLVPAN